VRPPAAVEEVGVEEERRAVAPDADRQPAAHPVEAQGSIASLAMGPVRHGAGRGRHVDLGLDPGDRDLRRLLHHRGQHAVGDGEDVGLERGTLVPGADRRHDAGDRHGAAVGQLALRHDDIVELQVRIRADGDPEGQRARVLRTQHPPDRAAGVVARDCGVGEAHAHRP
jgi:hypothetical protein